MASLKEYHRKRSFDRTPEPAGAVRKSEDDNVFVVQKHAATRLHYDLRLEVDGVLKSWAVPKGPSLNPADKRLAVQVEDHPFDYRTFEGSIPKGQYGGGEVIVWDQGTYAPEGAMSARDQIARGELKFRLDGEKLRGSFVLVRIRKKEEQKNEWLLIKHRDEAADSNWDAEQHAESVVTGRTLQDIAEGRTEPLKGKRTPISEIPGAVKAPMPSMPQGMPVTLAQLREGVFSDPDWLFEIKWDGVRTLAQIQNGKVKLWARSGRDITGEYPDLADVPKYLRVKEAIADGEIVTLDANGRSDFHKLQNRLGVSRPSEKLMQSIPPTYYLFDLLYADGFDLRKAPLIERKELLCRLVVPNDKVRYSSHVVEKGKELFEAAREKNLEGIIAKLADSPYPGSRTSSWLKLKISTELDAVVAGWTEGRGTREFFGALVLGLYDKDELKFIGNVGTGFNRETQKEVFDALEPLETSRSPFEHPPKLREAVRWVKPNLVARVKYGNWTHDNHLRVPVFLSLAKDRTPDECTFTAEKPAAAKELPKPRKSGRAAEIPQSAANPTEPEAAETSPDSPKAIPATKSRKIATKLESKTPSSPKLSRSNAKTAEDPADELSNGSADSLDVNTDGVRVHLTHLNKIYFPEVGLKKRDLLAHYFRMAPYILPFLKDRPMVLRRYPDGVGGKAFFQKEAPSYLPDWIETATVHSDERGGNMQYILANSRAALLYLTNLGCIDHNPWSSRAESQDYPDYVFFDLDPTPDAKFSDVIHIAQEIHAILTRIRLKSFLKTSGADGIHIFVPLQPRYTYEQTRSFAEIVGRMVASQNPKLLTFERSVAKRPKGRIMVDSLQNAWGKPLASAYSVRAYPTAPISMPLEAKELASLKSPGQWTPKNVTQRMEQVGDLWRDFWKKPQLLNDAIDRLGKQMPKSEVSGS
jgi:bifunctional non-homologous end joining protein LigD